jgi:hypothetical protein
MYTLKGVRDVEDGTPVGVLERKPKRKVTPRERAIQVARGAIWLHRIERVLHWLGAGVLLWLILAVPVTWAQGPAAQETPMLARWEIVYLVLTVTQLAKTMAEPHLKGKRSAAVALVLGAVLFGINSAAKEEVIGESFMMWVRIVVRTIGYAVSVPGLYSLMKDEALPAVGAKTPRP